MTRGLPGSRQRDPTVDQQDWKLGLGTGQRQAKSTFAGEHRPDRQAIKQRYQAVVIKNIGLSIAPRRWRFALRQKHQSARDFTAQVLQQPEVIACGDAQGPGNGYALRIFGQHALEEWLAFATAKRLPALGQ
ncbi:hypothetical protein ACFB49_32750 [Sphingomonas sp. DBB INV C78]